MTQELKVIQDFYDLSTYLSARILSFPRNIRYGLGASLERRLQDVLALLIRAKFTPVAIRVEVLRDVNIELEVMRFQIRQAAELRALPQGSQHHALTRLQGIGQQVGGWLRSLRTSAS